MNKKQKFEKFLESLKGQGQDALIESVKKGFQLCYENVSPETDEILDLMNKLGISWEAAKKQYTSTESELKKETPVDPKIQEVLDKYAYKNNISNLRREIADSQYFKASGTFGAITQVNDFLKNKGYSIGSMQRDYPMAIAKSDMYISKWHNLGEDKARIDGVVIPDPEFREGGALVIFFKESVLSNE